MCRDDGKRSDGMSLIPWSRGLPLLWEYTFGFGFTLPILCRCEDFAASFWVISRIAPNTIDIYWQGLKRRLACDS